MSNQRTLQVRGHVGGLYTLYVMLLQVAEVYIDDEIYPYRTGPVEALVDEWLLEPYRVFEPSDADMDDPIREVTAVFWGRSELEDLFSIISDTNYKPISIRISERDFYTVELLPLEVTNEPDINGFKFRQSVAL